MKCLIIAAGKGSRLEHTGISKPLTPIAGAPLIARVIAQVIAAGISEILIVTGYDGENVRTLIDRVTADGDVKITHIENDEWEKPNGISVLKAKPHLTEPFILTMGDHIADPVIISNLMNVSLEENDVCLATDFREKEAPFNIPDATKVRVESGNIEAIGKDINDYNGIDTGMFLCTPGIFQAIEKSVDKNSDESLSGGIRVLAAGGKATIMDIGDAYWMDVDDENDIAAAEAALLPRTP